MEWSKIISGILGTPMNVLPPIQDTSGLFGFCDPELFGAAIPITAIVSDEASVIVCIYKFIVSMFLPHTVLFCCC